MGAGLEDCFRFMSALKPEDVEKTITIRREPHTVLQALNRVIAHPCATHRADCLPGEIFPLRKLEDPQRAAREERRIQREDAWQTPGPEDLASGSSVGQQRLRTCLFYRRLSLA